jgi:hypothetical protein
MVHRALVFALSGGDFRGASVPTVFLLVRGLSVLVGDTGFEPVTSSVSVISGSLDNAVSRVIGVRGCTPMIAGCCTD